MEQNNPFEMKIVWLPIDEIIPFERNSKKHPKEQVDNIARQIAAFGFDQPISLDKDMVIIKGHGRRLAAIALGLKKVPCVIKAHLNDEQVRLERIGDNKVAESDWDLDMLKFEVGSLDSLDADLRLTGMDEDYLKEFLKEPTDGSQLQSSTKSLDAYEEDYDNSDVRQISLVCDPETFNRLMVRFGKIQEVEGLQTNLEVVDFLVQKYLEQNEIEGI